MKRKAAAILTSVLICLFGVQGAFPWGSLTHAYITGQIVAEDGVVRDNAIYGSTAPDFANYMFGSPYQQYLMDRTHTDFLGVWKMARGGPIHIEERAVAFGFVAHNVEDYTAHTMSQKLLNHEAGYVIQKAAILEAMLWNAYVWQNLELDGEAYAPMRAELSHELIEFAGDIYVALFMNPQAGDLLSAAADECSNDLPALLTKAYAGNLVANSNGIGIRLNQPAASNILTGGELMFRGGMTAYGNRFNGSPSEILSNLAEYLVLMAGAQGINITNSGLVALVLTGALSVIQSDFEDEIIGTISFTAAGLAQQKVAY